MKRHSTPRWGALAAFALLSACGTGTADAPSPSSRAQALRSADVDPAEVARIKAAVKPLVNRDPANIRWVREPNGAVRREFRSGFQNVVLLHRAAADGKATLTCVDNESGVDQALSAGQPWAVQ